MQHLRYQDYQPVQRNLKSEEESNDKSHLLAPRSFYLVAIPHTLLDSEYHHLCTPNERDSIPVELHFWPVRTYLGSI